MKYSKIIFTIIFFCLFVTSFRTVAAQDATDSSATKEALPKRIDRILKEKQPEVAGALAEISIKKRGFVGPIERVSATSLTIATHKGPLVLPLDETVKVLKSNKEISITDLSVDNLVVAIGTEIDGTFMPKYILSSGTSEKPKVRMVLLGTLTGIEKSTLTLKTRGTNETKEVTVNKSTEYQNSDGSEISLKMLGEDLTILVIATDDEDGLTATTIRSLAPLSDPKKS